MFIVFSTKSKKFHMKQFSNLFFHSRLQFHTLVSLGSPFLFLIFFYHFLSIISNFFLCHYQLIKQTLKLFLSFWIFIILNPGSYHCIIKLWTAPCKVEVMCVTKNDRCQLSSVSSLHLPACCTHGQPQAAGLQWGFCQSSAGHVNAPCGCHSWHDGGL